LLCIVLMGGGAYITIWSMNKDWCPATVTIGDRCPCPSRESQLTPAGSLLASGIMLMSVALFQHACYYGPSTSNRAVSARSGEYWCSRWWTPAAAFLTELDTGTIWIMMLGFVLGCSGLEMSDQLSVCHQPSPPSSTVTGTVCWCPIHETLMAIGSGLMAAGIPPLCLSFLWNKDLSRQRLIQSTMRMIIEQRAAAHRGAGGMMATNGMMRSAAVTAAMMAHSGADGRHLARGDSNASIAAAIVLAAENTGLHASHHAPPSRCHRCGCGIGSHQKFCSQCGWAVPAPPKLGQCPSCHTLNQATSRFCLQCGTSLIPPPPASVATIAGAPAAAPPSGIVAAPLSATEQQLQAQLGPPPVLVAIS
jgi:hypothetical protein